MLCKGELNLTFSALLFVFPVVLSKYAACMLQHVYEKYQFAVLTAAMPPAPSYAFLLFD